MAQIHTRSTSIPRQNHLRAAAAIASVLAGMTAVLGTAGTASAHSSLLHINLKPGTIYRHGTYPRTIVADFTENINPKTSFVHVFEGDPSGDHGQVDSGTNGFPFKHQKEITTTLPRGLRGRYTVMWFTKSADDGHEAGNAFSFTVT